LLEEIFPPGVVILYAPFVGEISKPSLLPQVVLIKLWVAPESKRIITG
jgi:hypothetical protein